jgi:hypothetical protein
LYKWNIVKFKHNNELRNNKHPMTRPHSDRNQGRKLEPKAVRIRIPEMYRDHIRAEIKRLKATAEYKAVVKRINDEEGD